MSARSEAIDQFLTQAGWKGAVRTSLAGDASFRRYERVTHGEKKSVLMDAPPEKEDVRPFIRIAQYLAEGGLSAPRILAADEAQGLLLLEDLGDDLFARVLSKTPQQEEALYLAAADVLVELYAQAEKTQYHGVPLYDMDRFLQQVALLPEWFLPAASGEKISAPAMSEYLELWRKALAQLPPLRRVLVLYDYHAENLLWLPGRKDAERAGLLDFQDGVLGLPAYDMVSYLEDARRDVSAATVARAIDYYLEKTLLPRGEFMMAYDLLGAQRNTRIVGTFARLAVRDGKQQYLAFLPRVWAHLERDLKHPRLKEVKAWMDDTIGPTWRGVLSINAKARATG